MSRTYYRMLSNMYHACANLTQANVTTARSRNLTRCRSFRNNRRTGDSSSMEPSSRPLHMYANRKTVPSSMKLWPAKARRSVHKTSCKMTTSKKFKIKVGKSSHHGFSYYNTRTVNKPSSVAIQLGPKRSYSKSSYTGNRVMFHVPQRIYEQFMKSAENNMRFHRQPMADLQPSSETWRSKLVYDKIALDTSITKTKKLKTHLAALSKESIDARKKKCATFVPSFCEQLQQFTLLD